MASRCPDRQPENAWLSISICNDECFVLVEINTMRLVEVTG